MRDALVRGITGVALLGLCGSPHTDGRTLRSGVRDRDTIGLERRLVAAPLWQRARSTKGKANMADLEELSDEAAEVPPKPTRPRRQVTVGVTAGIHLGRALNA